MNAERASLPSFLDLTLSPSLPPCLATLCPDLLTSTPNPRAGPPPDAAAGSETSLRARQAGKALVRWWTSRCRHLPFAARVRLERVAVLKAVCFPASRWPSREALLCLPAEIPWPHSVLAAPGSAAARRRRAVCRCNAGFEARAAARRADIDRPHIGADRQATVPPAARNRDSSCPIRAGAVPKRCPNAHPNGAAHSDSTRESTSEVAGNTGQGRAGRRLAPPLGQREPTDRCTRSSRTSCLLVDPVHPVVEEVVRIQLRRVVDRVAGYQDERRIHGHIDSDADAGKPDTDAYLSGRRGDQAKRHPQCDEFAAHFFVNSAGRRESNRQSHPRQHRARDRTPGAAMAVPWVPARSDNSLSFSAG